MLGLAPLASTGDGDGGAREAEGEEERRTMTERTDEELYFMRRMSYCGSLRASGEASHHHDIFFTVFDDVPLWMKTACAAFYDFNPNVTHRLASTLLGPNQESEPSFLAAG